MNWRLYYIVQNISLYRQHSDAVGQWSWYSIYTKANDSDLVSLCEGFCRRRRFP